MYLAALLAACLVAFHSVSVSAVCADGELALATRRICEAWPSRSNFQRCWLERVVLAGGNKNDGCTPVSRNTEARSLCGVGWENDVSVKCGHGSTDQNEPGIVTMKRGKTWGKCDRPGTLQHCWENTYGFGPVDYTFVDWCCKPMPSTE